MKAKLVKSVQEVAYHRNGISGKGFYAVRFTSDIEEDDGTLGGRIPPVHPTVAAHESANWLAIVTDDPGECYVICLDLIPTCGVKFAGGNSWRGDHYEAELRNDIRELRSELRGLREELTATQ